MKQGVFCQLQKAFSDQKVDFNFFEQNVYRLIYEKYTCAIFFSPRLC